MVYFQQNGNWEGFLEIVSEFLLYCFSQNQRIYAKNLSYFYYCYKLSLKTDKQEAFDHKQEGGFTSLLTIVAHTKIPMDQIIETLINRWSKEVGGLSGKMENKGASERWICINHFMSVLKEHQYVKIRRKKRIQHDDL